jgi:hypothetical protein
MRFITLKRGVWFAFLVMAVLGSSTGIALGQDENSELKNIKKEIDAIRDELHRTIEDKQKKIDELERQIQTLRVKPTAQEEPKSTQSAAAEPIPGESALDRAVKGLEQHQELGKKGDLYSQQMGGATLRLMDISFDILFDAGTSTEPDSSIKILEGGRLFCGSLRSWRAITGPTASSRTPGAPPSIFRPQRFTIGGFILSSSMVSTGAGRPGCAWNT